MKLIGMVGRLTDRQRDPGLRSQTGSHSMPKLDYDVCARCGQLFDDQGENGWWIREGLWWHECDTKRPARIVVRKLELTKTASAA
ncbi:MAG TPA: hypothetical protein VN716_29345 [Vicinamibacterales bacterium]|nr:hypothetical protein [Vicinamibacterales bacterium]